MIWLPTINFTPTWITVFEFVSASQGHTVKRTSDPIELASLTLDGVTTSNQLGFNVDEILSVIQKSDSPVNVFLKLDVVTGTRWMQVTLHEYINQRFSGPGNYRMTNTQAALVLGNNLVNINNLFWNNTFHTFAEAIQQGFKGLYLYKSGAGSTAGVGSARGVEIVVEGTWSIQTPSIQSLQGGEIQNVNEPATFRWQHNGSFNQVGYDLRYRRRGNPLWTTLTRTSTAQSHVLTSGSLSTGEYEWQIRTRSQYGYESNWSQISIFEVADSTPSPIITYPENDGTVTVSDLQLSWEASEQNRYEIQILNDSNEVIWSDTRTSTVRAVTVEGILENNKSYTVRLRVNRQFGIWSNWAEISFEVVYAPPPKPLLTFEKIVENAAIGVTINNPSPEGSQPGITSQTLFRQSDAGLVKLAEGLERNVTIMDYTPASGVDYEYFVIVRGDNGTTVTSDNYNFEIEVPNAILSLVNDPQQYIKLIMNPKRTVNINRSKAKKFYSGREKPTTEFGEHKETKIALSFLITHEELAMLEKLENSQDTLLYRDIRGRKFFSTFDDFSISDYVKSTELFNVQLTLSEVDFHEGVD